jgi:hypothetical protein
MATQLTDEELFQYCKLTTSLKPKSEAAEFLPTSEGVSQKNYAPVVLSFFFFSHSVSPALQCFRPQAATAAVDVTLMANKPTSAIANKDFMNKTPFLEANRTRELLSCIG